MAKLIPIDPADPSYKILSSLWGETKKYVITIAKLLSPGVYERRIAGFYRSAEQSFKICKQIAASGPLAPICWLVVGTSIYFVDDGGPFHP